MAPLWLTLAGVASSAEVATSFLGWMSGLFHREASKAAEAVQNQAEILVNLSLLKLRTDQKNAKDLSINATRKIPSTVLTNCPFALS